MAELLRELVSGIWDLSKVTRGLVGLSICMHKQNAELIKLGKRQVFLAEQARKVGLGLDLETEKEEERGSEKDKGKGKEKETKGIDETLGQSNGDLGSDEDEEGDRDMRMEE
jgi:hypothetical protein